MRTAFLFTLLVAAASAGSAPLARASWYPGGTAIVAASGTQRYVHPVSDGAGGMVLVFEDQRGATGSDIWAQHVGVNGPDPAWPATGRALCTANGDQGKLTRQIAAASDGAGGAFAVWTDPRGADDDIYLQHVLASGAVDPAWPANGLAVCNASGNQNYPVVCGDGAGGAIVAWHDARGAAADIYAQRVLAAGNVDPAWPANGRLVCGATNAQFLPAILADGAGGALIAWQDFRNATNYVAHAQRVLANGTVDPAWPADGRAVSAGAVTVQGVKLASDGGTGALLAWDGTIGSDGSDVWGHHVSRDGVLDAAWPVGGLQLTAGLHSQSLRSIVPDGSGGAYVAWIDMRNGSGGSNADIYAQRVSAAGQNLWGSSGLSVCNATDEQMDPQLAADPAGAVYAFWQDRRSANVYELYGQRLSSSGAVDPAWPVNGALLGAAGAGVFVPMAVADGAGGAIVAWNDGRNATNGTDLYARRVGAAGVHRITVSQTGSGTVELASPALVTASFADVTEYDTAVFWATPQAGWFLNAVSVNGIAVGAPPNVSFGGVTTNQQLSVSFSGASVTTSLTLNAGNYAAFGVPLALSGTVDQQLAALGARSDAAWRLARWNPATSSYDFAGGALAAIQPGEGYWLVSANAAALEFTGAPLLPVAYAIPLAGGVASGWNQVANPFRFEVADSALLVRVSGVGDVPFLSVSNTYTDTLLWEWTGAGGYVAARSLAPGRAYWVKKKSDTGVSLVVPHRSSTRAAAPPALPAGAEWAVALVARQDGRRTTRVWAGVASAAGAAARVIAAPPDAPGRAPSLAIAGGQGARAVQRLVASGDEHAWTLTLAGVSAPGVVALECEAFELPAGVRLWLSDEALGWTRELVPGEAIELAAFAGPRTLTLRAGASAAPEPAAAPRVLAWPNPFRASAGLVFTLPRGGELGVEIVDIAGRLVRRLGARAAAAGEQVVTWDGRDDRGAPVAPGVYLARHRAAGVVGCIRLVKLP